nr:uncharacterized protein LOC113808835 [Penaeus vannamei]
MGKGVPCMRRAGASPDSSEKYARATQSGADSANDDSSKAKEQKLDRDYIMNWNEGKCDSTANLRDITSCKIIYGESTASQHKVVAMDWEYERKYKCGKSQGYSTGYVQRVRRKGGRKPKLRTAKARDKATKEYTQIIQMEDGEGMVQNKEEKIRDRWKSYFESLLNEENHRAVFEDGAPNFGVPCDIRRQEVKDALRKMKNVKATGPDNIPAEVWKCLGDEGIDMLWDLMTKICEEEKIPNKWRDNVIIPI